MTGQEYQFVSKGTGLKSFSESPGFESKNGKGGTGKTTRRRRG